MKSNINEVLTALRINPEYLMSYLEQKVEEDRAIQMAYGDMFKCCELIDQDTKITNAELLLSHLRKH